MADETTEHGHPTEPAGAVVDSGGLTFETSFREPAGATLRVYGRVAGHRTELLRFDDFVSTPHYHVPADGPAIEFDRHQLGAPLDWFVGELRAHLGQLLTTAGYAEILPELDLQSVDNDADRIKKAMEDCVPEGYVRVPGHGLQPVDA
jgi:hypothetical protein